MGLDRGIKNRSCASRMKLTGINQLWVADITYIRLKTESYASP
jgi:hypothetical protein